MKQCSMFFGISFFHSASICFNFETISGDLAFSQCEFKSTPDDLFSQAERSIGNENFSGRFQQPVEELVQPFPRLKNLKLRSQCSKTYFRQSLYDIHIFPSILFKYSECKYPLLQFLWRPIQVIFLFDEYKDA